MPQICDSNKKSPEIFMGLPRPCIDIDYMVYLTKKPHIKIYNKSLEILIYKICLESTHLNRIFRKTISDHISNRAVQGLSIIIKDC